MFFSKRPQTAAGLIPILLAFFVSSLAQATTIPPIWDDPTGGTVSPLCDDCTYPMNFGLSIPAFGTAYTSGFISTNGFLTLGSIDNGDGCCTGDILGLLGGSPRIAPAWMDWVTDITQKTYGDHVTFTWNGAEYSSGLPILAQLQLYASGKIIFAFADAVDGGHTMLMGVSPGGGAPDPGQSNFYSTPFTVAGYTAYQTFTPGQTDALSGRDIILTPTGSAGWNESADFVGVPEPASFSLLAAGTGLLMIRFRRAAS